MKPRHQTTAAGSVMNVRREKPHFAEKRENRPLQNVELRKSARGQFLVFKTRDGNTFHLNLDCQEEYGFEAKRVLQQWACEQ
jgi:hypothetical protein